MYRGGRSAMSVSSPIVRLKRKLGVENLWLYVLAELCREDNYPYDLVKAIQRDFGFRPGRVLPYIVLSKLESEGLVESYYAERRKYYRVTEKGRKVLAEGVSYLKSLSEKLASVAGLDVGS